MRETSPAPGGQPADIPPRWPLYAVVCGLLPLAIAGTFVLSAAATIAMAADSEVPGPVQPATVLMLEVVNLAGSTLAIVSTSKTGRRSGYVATILSALVQLAAGVSAYGPFGAMPAVALILLVHLASVAWRELRRAKTTPAATPAKVPAATPAKVPVPGVPEPTTPELRKAEDPFDLAPMGPVQGCARNLREAVRAEVKENPEVTARELWRRGWCSRHTAGTELAQARSGLTVVAS